MAYNMDYSDTNESEKISEKLKRGLLIVAGTISLIIGTIGIVIPVLPTTPFLLIATACYLRGSERLHNWMLNNRVIGDFIKNYNEGKGISTKHKIFTITFLWFTIMISTLFFVSLLYLRIVLIIIAIIVTTHIFTLPTYKK
jgi:uncharacterized membrane protein YbaN (DUF454 family)